MNVFKLCDFVTREYERFSTGYSTFRAQDIKMEKYGEYRTRRLVLEVYDRLKVVEND